MRLSILAATVAISTALAGVALAQDVVATAPQPAGTQGVVAMGGVLVPQAATSAPFAGDPVAANLNSAGSALERSQALR